MYSIPVPVLPESSENYLSHGYVPNLYEHLAEARIAIVHGGLTTLHEALLFNKPVLIIMDPGHPEQQNNAKKIVDMGAGMSIDGRTVTKEIIRTKDRRDAGTLSQKTRYGLCGGCWQEECCGDHRGCRRSWGKRKD